MELGKRQVRLCSVEMNMKKIKTMDEDVNVPETKGDIGKIICSNYDVIIEGMKVTEKKEAVKGCIEFDILYLNQENGSLEHLEGRYPFEETFELEDVVMSARLRAVAGIEDFTVKVINSRKINVKSLYEISCKGMEIKEDDIVTEADDQDMLISKENMIFSQLKADAEDTFRIKEDIELPKNKPNVRNLIWKDLRLKSREARLLDNGVYIKGDIGIFIIYVSDNSEDVTQWYETAIPFEGKIELSGVNEEMYSIILMKLQDAQITIRPDYDGEERVLGIEGIITLDIKAYSEEEINVVQDMYSLTNHVDIECKDKDFQQMVMKNSIKARGYNKYKMKDTDEKPLQICYAYGDAHMENVDFNDEGVKITGFVDATVIYVSADDSNPMSSFKCQVPFEQVVNTDEIIQHPVCSINLCVEQINASMISGDEIEVRAFVGVEILVMKQLTQKFITNVQKNPMTSGELSSFPGIIGYIAGSEESLWDIAKKYKTTVEKIRNLNKNISDKVRKGEKILIIR